MSSHRTTCHLPLATLRMGTRRSPLALAQAEWVKARLCTLHPGLEITIIPMMTSGDAIQSRPLSEIGGKGLFTKEIEEALLGGDIDLAVHSAKDMQTVLPDGLVLACTPEREDARDALVSAHAYTLEELPLNALFGTSSLRRAAQVLHVRPDITIVPLRGNVQTRLAKIESGVAHATMLAMAGLKRLNMQPLPGVPIAVQDCIPAAGQGALGLECREGDVRTRSLLEALNHTPTMLAVTAERALLAALDGSCRTPIGAYAQIVHGELSMRAMLANNDGSHCWFAEIKGAIDAPEILGQMVAENLLAQCG